MMRSLLKDEVLARRGACRRDWLWARDDGMLGKLLGVGTTG